MIRVTYWRDGSEEVEVCELPGPTISIGRGEDNDVVLAHSRVSLWHARVTCGSGGLVLVDNNSTNGTFVDGALLRAPREICAEDEVHIGAFTLYFELIEESAADANDRGELGDVGDDPGDLNEPDVVPKEWGELGEPLGDEPGEFDEPDVLSFGEPPLLRDPDPPSASSTSEARVFELALPRSLPVGEPADLFVLIRCVGGRPLRERLVDKGLDAPGPRDLDSLPMRLDFLLSPRGEALPLALVVELRTHDFECDEPRRRFRVYHGQDSPLLQFWVRPRRTGKLRVMVEVSLESEILGAEVLGCLCVDREVEAAGAPEYACISSPVRPVGAGASVGTAVDLGLHELLVSIFDASELYRWVALRFGPWRRSLASPCVSLNEMAFSVIDTGRRAGHIDARFFAELRASFPALVDDIDRVEAAWTPASGVQRASAS